MLSFFYKKKQKQLLGSLDQEINPEDILLDGQSHNYAKIELPVKQAHFLIFYILISVTLLFFISVLCYYQVWGKQEYQLAAQNNYLRTLTQPSVRGVIYDSKGEQLVFNVLKSNLVLYPQQLKNQPEKIKPISQFLSKISSRPLEDTEKELRSLINEQQLSPMLWKEDLSHEEILESTEFFSQELAVGENFSPLILNEDLTRYYPDSLTFSHILGYISQIGPDELKQCNDCSYFEKVGRSSLESTYQEILRGQPSSQDLKVDARGQILKIFNQRQSAPGQSLVLSVDASLQRFITQTLQQKLSDLKIKHGVVIAQDPQTGRILAMVSLPSYDNNLFSGGIDSNDYQNLINDPQKPLFNRAIAGLYPPGSTIKPFIGSGVLQEKVVSPQWSYECTGGISVPNQYDPNIIYYFKYFKPHGHIDFFSAIAKSCNSYFYITGGGYGNIKGLGIDGLDKYLSLFNFGAKTGIDLAPEDTGLVPTPQWKKENKGEDWYTGDTYHLAIGQGDLLVTPLQLTVAMSGLANKKGILYQPSLLKEIVDANKNTVAKIEPKIIRRDFLSQNTIDLVNKAMRQSVTDGILGSLADLKYPVAGKTGTAQFGSDDQTHAWVIAYGPYQNPEIVVTVLVEAGGLGGGSALPVAKEIFKWYFDNR